MTKNQRIRMILYFGVLSTSNLFLMSSLAIAQEEDAACPSDLTVVWTNCIGTITTEDGNTYSGFWIDDRPSGQGVLTFSDGSVYKGEFSDGKRHGNGILEDKDGNIVKEGRWENNVLLESVNADIDKQSEYSDNIVIDFDSADLLEMVARDFGGFKRNFSCGEYSCRAVMNSDKLEYYFLKYFWNPKDEKPYIVNIEVTRCSELHESVDENYVYDWNGASASYMSIVPEIRSLCLSAYLNNFGSEILVSDVKYLFTTLNEDFSLLGRNLTDPNYIE